MEKLLKGSKVWVTTPEAREMKVPNDWSLGIVERVDGDDKITVKYENSQEVVSTKIVLIANPDIQSAEDNLITLSALNQPCILHNLTERYMKNLIYTYCGTILIAVNPYAYSPEVYSSSKIAEYVHQPIGKLPPHVYAIAENAYRSMLLDGQSQSIIVSGESGAGKTETTKFLLQYFATVAKSHQTDLEGKIIQSTPILEAFGNAKTIWNDNSSRFGKFIKIQFDKNGTIAGATISTYLLEKTRVVRAQQKERSYHIFYQLCAGADAETKKKLLLKSVNEFRYLAQTGCFQANKDVDDAKVFAKTVEALDSVGIDPTQRFNMFKVLAAILHLGDLEFVGDEAAKIKDSAPLKIACELLQCDANELERSILSREIKVGNESTRSPNSAVKATNSRDSFTMLLYSRMFDWLVHQINQTLAGDPTQNWSFVAILDIYGFECFDLNSFEQFCINYANEKLQNEFNHRIFKLEQDEYIKEGIDWSTVDFKDNSECIDLIEQQGRGILAVLDEETRFPKASDETLVKKLVANQSKHINFKPPEFGEIAFTIVHYAGRVKYHTAQWLEKNRDFIIPEQVNLLKKGIPFVADLIRLQEQQHEEIARSPSPMRSPRAEQRNSVRNIPLSPAPGRAPQAAAGNVFISVASQFRDSLTSLIDTIESTNSNYIRCVKPNDEKKPKLFQPRKVLHQLRCGGVLEAARIAAAGFPTRIPLDTFYSRYRLLIKKANDKDIKVSMKKFFEEQQKWDSGKWQFGKSKLFMRAGLIAYLEQQRQNKLDEAATRIAKNYRMFRERKMYRALMGGLKAIQAAVRQKVARARYLQMRSERAAIIVQKWFRMYIASKQYLSQYLSIVTLQKSLRCALVKKEVLHLRRKRLALLVQRNARTVSAAQFWKRFRKAVVIAQTRYRGRMARAELRRLKAEARSVAEVQRQKNELAAKLAEMERKHKEESDARAKSEAERLAAEQKANEERKKKEEESRAAEEEKRRAEKEKKRAEKEKKRIEEEQKRAEEIRRAAEEQRKKLEAETAVAIEKAREEAAAAALAAAAGSGTLRRRNINPADIALPKVDLSAALGADVTGGDGDDADEFDLAEIESLLVQQEAALEQQLNQVFAGRKSKRFTQEAKKNLATALEKVMLQELSALKEQIPELSDRQIETIRARKTAKLEKLLESVPVISVSAPPSPAVPAPNLADVLGPEVEEEQEKAPAPPSPADAPKSKAISASSRKSSAGATRAVTPSDATGDWTAEDATTAEDHAAEEEFERKLAEERRNREAERKRYEDEMNTMRREMAVREEALRHLLSQQQTQASISPSMSTSSRQSQASPQRPALPRNTPLPPPLSVSAKTNSLTALRAAPRSDLVDDEEDDQINHPQMHSQQQRSQTVVEFQPSPASPRSPRDRKHSTSLQPDDEFNPIHQPPLDNEDEEDFPNRQRSRSNRQYAQAPQSLRPPSGGSSRSNTGAPLPQRRDSNQVYPTLPRGIHAVATTTNSGQTGSGYQNSTFLEDEDNTYDPTAAQPAYLREAEFSHADNEHHDLAEPVQGEDNPIFQPDPYIDEPNGGSTYHRRGTNPDAYPLHPQRDYYDPRTEQQFMEEAHQQHLQQLAMHHPHYAQLQQAGGDTDDETNGRGSTGGSSDPTKSKENPNYKCIIQ